jgi:hypothetical protein
MADTEPATRTATDLDQQLRSLGVPLVRVMVRNIHSCATPAELRQAFEASTGQIMHMMAVVITHCADMGGDKSAIAKIATEQFGPALEHHLRIYAQARILAATPTDGKPN